MAKVVGDIAIGVTADIGPLVRTMGKASSATNKFGRVAENVSRKLDKFSRQTASLGKKMSVVSGAIAGAAAASFALANSTAEAGDKIAKTARGAGVSAQYYQEMAYAIGQVSDVSEDELASSMQRLTKSIGEGADGAKAQVEALEKLGFTQSQIASGTITTQQAFDAYIKKMDGIKDPAIAAAISSDLLGRSGVRLGSQLAGAGGSVETLRDRANELGVVLSKDALDASEKFGDNMDDLKRSFEAVKMQIGAELLPIMNDHLIPAIMDHVIPALKDFGKWVGEVIDWFVGLPDPVKKAIGAITAALAVGGPLLLALAGVSAAFSAIIAASGPIGLFILAAAAVATAWAKWGDDIKAAVGPAIDWISEKFNAFLGILDTVVEKAVAVKTAITDALSFGTQPDQGTTGMKQVGGLMADGLTQGLGEGLENNREAIRGYLEGVTDETKDVYDTNSPSRVFAEIGGYLGEGLAQGIAQSHALVNQAVATLGTAAVKGSDDTATGVLANMQTMFAGSKKLSAGIALANSWLAFTEVLKDPALVGRPFARIAAAGAALSAGLNAVKNIKSASIGGGSSSGGGGGGGATAAQPAPQPHIANITYQGQPTQDGFKSITEKLNEEFGQGYRLNLNFV